jgi:hypothetical protein
MADVKISALPGASTPLAGTELLELVQSGISTSVAASAVAASFSTAPANILPATAGGTGQSVYAVGDLLYASTTTALSKLADVATGNALISGGVGVVPSWGKIGLTTHVSGTLPTANGGTNLTSFTSGGAVYATSTSVLATGTLPVTAGGTGVATLTSGYLVRGLGTSAVTASVIYDDGNNLGIGTSSPAAGTILDVQSTTKGVRFPNMTTTQKNAMTGAAGAVIFDTTLAKLCVYTGAAWQTITSA